MRLKCTRGALQGEAFELDPLQSYIIGRKPEAQDNATLIMLPSGSVSRTHCKIEYDGESFVIEDLQSANGIRVNRQKIQQARLNEKDVVQVGDFTFVFEEEQAPATETLPVEEDTGGGGSQEWSQGGEKPKKQREPILQKILSKLDTVDFKIKSLIIILGSGLFIHWIIATSFQSDVKKSLIVQSIENARREVQRLGERNKSQLAERAHYLLDCDFVKISREVELAFLFDSVGNPICPIGERMPFDEMTEQAIFRGEAMDDCWDRLLLGPFETCDLAFPVREWNKEGAQHQLVGIARIRYSPAEAFASMQRLESLSWKTLFFSLCVLVGLWWLILFWMKRGFSAVTEGVHSAVSGTTQIVEKPETFAALEPLVAEINKLISKSSQEVSPDSPGGAPEASFLQHLIQQVLLLEERAVMAVDKDNQLIAASASLTEVIPVNTELMNVHITESVEDTHLQGELMGLLNDLSLSDEVVDRSLSMADQIIQVRGLPIFLKSEYVAALLFF